MIDSLEALYQKYHAELLVLSRRMRPLYHSMQDAGYGTTFGDVEGEVLYMLTRETHPSIAVEISPNAGWSTNYILAALTENNYGTLHSFEIADSLHGQATEGVIRRHQIPQSDQGRLQVHIGDARETVPQAVNAIDLLLLDSCHEAWFAQWYIAAVFPKVRGPILIQDIAFHDRVEPSSEARFVWQWIAEQGIRVDLIGVLERAIHATTLRRGFAERRGLRCNSIVVSAPFVRGECPTLQPSADILLDEARTALQKGDHSTAVRLLDALVAEVRTDVTRVERHRLLLKAAALFVKIGDRAEARRCCQRAFGMVLELDRTQRLKALVELAPYFLKCRQWRLLLQVILLACLEPGARIPLLRSSFRFLRSLK